MQSKKKNGRATHATPIPKALTFSCGIFGICTPLLLSPRTPLRVPHDSGEYFSSEVLLIQRPSPKVAGESCDEPEANLTEADGGFDFSPWDILECATSDAPASPLEPRTEKAIAELEAPRELSSRRLPDPQRIEILLAKLRKGQWDRSGLDALLSPVGERRLEAVGEVEEKVGSALIDLLTSSTADESFRYTEPFYEGFAALVRLAHNGSVLEWTTRSEMLAILEWILQRGSLDSRVNAAILLQKIALNEDFHRAIANRQTLVDGVVSLMLKREHPNAAKHALRALLALCLSTENLSGAVRAGSVAAIMKILPGMPVTAGSAEQALAILELLATTPGGRAAMRGHELVVPLLVNVILRISDRATEYATGVLCAICAPDSREIQERAVHAGVQTRLLLLMQSHCTPRAKRKALQLLKGLHRFWEEETTNGAAARSMHGHPTPFRS